MSLPPGIRLGVYDVAALGTGNLGCTDDVSLDGRRFLMIKEGSGADAPPRDLVVVRRWTEELKRLVPVN